MSDPTKPILTGQRRRRGGREPIVQQTHGAVAGIVACLVVLGLTQPGAAQEPADVRTCKGRSETATADSVQDLNTWTEAELLEYFPILPPGELGLFIDDSGGDDVIVGTNRNDIIVVDGGDDVVCAGGGHDIFVGSGDPTGNSTVFLGLGDDFVRSSHGVRRVHGGPGHDLLITSAGTAVVRGGRGNDEIFFRGDGGVLRGGPGSDLVRAEGERIRAYGGPGGDSLVAGWGSVVFRGGPGPDRLTGPEHDEIFARSQLRGGGGDDHLTGAEEHLLRGGPGEDSCAFLLLQPNEDVQRDATCEQETPVFGDAGPEFTPPRSWWSSD